MAILMQHHFYLSPRVFVGVVVWTQGRDAAHNLWISEPRHVQVHPGSDTEVGWLHFFLQQLRHHSISFTRARSAPMYRIGLGREEGWKDWGTWAPCSGSLPSRAHSYETRSRVDIFLLDCFVPRPCIFLAPAHSMRDSGSPSRSRCTACD